MSANFIVVLVFIFFAVISAWKSKTLSLSGAIMAFIVGACIALGFGIKGLILLGIFFISSSMLSKFKKKKKRALEDIHEKGSTRDWAQVLANGGIAAAFGLATYWWNHPLFILAMCISLASANSDTWASELGSLSKRSPISIRGFKRVVKGTSGAISLIGTIAGFLGSVLIAGSAAFLFQLNLESFIIILLFGFIGMFIDTVLGAYLQAEFICAKCGRHIEKPFHCHVEAVPCKGQRWLRNDAVNFISCLSAVFLGVLIYSGF